MRGQPTQNEDAFLMVLSPNIFGRKIATTEYQPPAASAASQHATCNNRYDKPPEEACCNEKCLPVQQY